MLSLAVLLLAGLPLAEPAWAHRAHPAAGSAPASPRAPADLAPSAVADPLPGLAAPAPPSRPAAEGAVGAPAPAMPAVPWPVLLLAASLMILGLCRPRRALGLALAVLLAVLALETGVHSVHHLVDGREAQCAVASASGQLAGTVDDLAPRHAAMPLFAPGRLLAADASVPASRIPASHRDRGPPHALATA